jgi:hypothetical protein
VLNAQTDKKLRQCLWCPSKIDLILKLKPPHVTSRGVEGPSSSPTLPSGCGLQLVRPSTQTGTLMMEHLRGVHFKWHCKHDGCIDMFETKKGLEVHEKHAHAAQG